MATVASPAASGDTDALSGVDGRDAAGIDSRDWPDRPLKHPTTAERTDRFQVVYHQSALDAIHLHGQTRTDVEVGGVLLGTGYRDEHGSYLLVEHAIAGTSASSRSTNVTFTAEAWQQIQSVWDRDFPDKKMVGWYHTHPGFGIFLSDMDVFICDNFFNLPWQIAFVYDPLGGDEGNFVWRSGKPVREPILLEDDVTPKSAAVPLIPVSEAMTGTDPLHTPAPTSEFPRTSGSVHPDFPSAPSQYVGASPLDLPPDVAATLQSQTVELMARVRTLERRVKGLAFALLFLAVFVAVCVVTLIWSGMSGSQPSPATPMMAPGAQQMIQPPSAQSSVVPSPEAPSRAVAPNTHVGH